MTEIEDIGILSVEQCLEDYGYFTLEKENQEYACVIVIARAGGSVLAVPEAVYTEESHMADKSLDYPGVEGPRVLVSVPARNGSQKGRKGRTILKLWLVDFSEQGYSAMTALDLDDCPENFVPFAQSKAILWPHHESLLDVVEDFVTGVSQLEAFQSAHEGPSQSSASEVPLRRILGKSSMRHVKQDNEMTLLKKELEEQKKQYQVLLAKLNLLEQKPVKGPVLPVLGQPTPRGDSFDLPSDEEAPGQVKAPARPRGPRDQGLDGLLFREAARMGLSSEQAQKLQNLAGREPPRVAEVPMAGGPDARAAAKAKARLDIDLGDEEDEKEGGKSSRAVAMELMMQTMVQNQQMLNVMLNKPKASDDPMGLLLGKGTDLDDHTNVTGAKGCAARQMWVEQMELKGEGVYATVRRWLGRALKKPPEKLDASDMLRFHQSQVPYGHLKALTYSAMLFGHLWEAIEYEDMERVKALVALGNIFTEQCALEGGSHYTLAWLLTGLEEPPWAEIQARGSTVRGLNPHAKLADPKWVAVQLAYLRDVDLLHERTQKTHKGQKPPKGAGKEKAEE